MQMYFYNIGNKSQCYKTFFQCNYATIIITLVEFKSIYTKRGINYSEKSFITLATGVNVTKHFVEHFSALSA
jgi:hypothetical protein